MIPTSSGASATKSRKNRNTSAASLMGQATRPATKLGASGWSRILKGGDDPEVAATAPQTPEQVGVLVVAGDDELAVGGDHVAGCQAVDGEPKPAHEVADPAAQGQPADAGVGDDAAGHGQAERLGLVVDLAPETATLGSCRS
jgi:hypothetical protein